MSQMHKSKLLITGVSGMLGGALAEELVSKYSLIGLDKSKPRISITNFIQYIENDITDYEHTREVIDRVAPEFIIHAAAYTDVDGCQLYPKIARKINIEASRNIAVVSEKVGATLFYISTDFVFDGKKNAAYTEIDTPNPINTYGKTKLAAEDYIRNRLDKSMIIRTSWLFGEGGKNFVDAILFKAKKDEKIKVVNDQFGSPTYTKDLARAIDKIMSLLASNVRLQSIYNVTNGGSCSRYEFARTIVASAGLNDANISAITSRELDLPAARPKMSILDNSIYNQLTNQPLRSWQEALREYLNF